MWRAQMNSRLHDSRLFWTDLGRETQESQNGITSKKIISKVESMTFWAHSTVHPIIVWCQIITLLQKNPMIDVNVQNKVPLLCSYCHRVTERLWLEGSWGGHLLLAQAQTPRAGCPDCGYACNISAFSVLLNLRLHSSYSSHSYLQAQYQADCGGICRCNTSLK